MNQIKACTILFIISIFASCETPPEERTGYPDADDFIINQFDEKEVIFLGEIHWIKEHVNFVKELIPELHKNGIHYLFFEFASYEDNYLIDSLLSAPVFDESLARYIQHKNSWDWAFKEYLELYFAAWKTNQNLKPNQKPFKIIAIETFDAGIMDTEQFWAYVIDSLSFSAGEKGLVYCGLHHAFTNYYHPYVVGDKFEGYVRSRAGNWLYRKHPDKVATVLIHGPWYGKSYDHYVFPCNGKIDSVFVNNPKINGPVGFGSGDTVFGKLSLEGSLYAHGYPNGKLSDICHGYIVLEPLCELEKVTIIPDFVNEQNLEETMRQSELGQLSTKAFNDTIRTWLNYSVAKMVELQNINCK